MPEVAAYDAPLSEIVSLTSGRRVLLWRDAEPRDGASQMALDEALLHTAANPVLRFYQWQKPEITIGVFVPLASLSHRSEPITRRWTGGGVVEHGEDLTFSLSLPRPFLDLSARTIDTYRLIHEALASSLRSAGLDSAVAVPVSKVPAVSESGPGFCFSAPVAWDVMCRNTGAKLAGGAQRRSRDGLLHQGSVRLPAPWNPLDHGWIEEFARRISGSESPGLLSPAGINDATSLAKALERERYASPDWLSRH